LFNLLGKLWQSNVEANNLCSLQYICERITSTLKLLLVCVHPTSQELMMSVLPNVGRLKRRRERLNYRRRTGGNGKRGLTVRWQQLPERGNGLRDLQSCSALKKRKRKLLPENPPGPPSFMLLAAFYQRGQGTGGFSELTPFPPYIYISFWA